MAMRARRLTAERWRPLVATAGSCAVEAGPMILLTFDLPIAEMFRLEIDLEVSASVSQGRFDLSSLSRSTPGSAEDRSALSSGCQIACGPILPLMTNVGDGHLLIATSYRS